MIIVYVLIPLWFLAACSIAACMLSSQISERERERMIDLDAIKAREEKATMGPWTFNQDTITIQNDEGHDITAVYGTETEVLADADFIAHARKDVPALVEEVERLRVELDGFETLIAHHREHHLQEERLRTFKEQAINFYPHLDVDND